MGACDSPSGVWWASWVACMIQALMNPWNPQRWSDEEKGCIRLIVNDNNTRDWTLVPWCPKAHSVSAKSMGKAAFLLPTASHVQPPRTPHCFRTQKTCALFFCFFFDFVAFLVSFRHDGDQSWKSNMRNWMWSGVVEVVEMHGMQSQEQSIRNRMPRSS